MKIDPALWIKPDFSFLPDYEKQERDDRWSLRFAFTAFFVGLILLFFTASVAAGDDSGFVTVDEILAKQWAESKHILRDSCWRPIGIDTMRFYAKVDTVTSYMSGYYGSYLDGDTLRLVADGYEIVDSWDSLGYLGEWVFFGRTFIVDLDTTWLPKVPVYLDSCKYRELMEWLFVKASLTKGVLPWR